SDWLRTIDETAESDVTELLFAEVDGRLAGMARCGLAADDSTKGQVFSMWVDPEFRRRGVGRALVLAALDWLNDRGALIAELGVNENNVEAIALYAGLGFAFTGDSEPLRAGSSEREVTMRCV